MNVATSKQLPIIGVRIPNTYGSESLLFKKRNLPLVNWNVDEIKKEIDKYI